MKTFVRRRSFACAAILAIVARVHGQPPVNWTSAEDHQHMMEQLGISALRPGPSGNEAAADHANYDEATANPFPNLPDPLITNGGKKVTTAEMWNTVRRSEIDARREGGDGHRRLRRARQLQVGNRDAAAERGRAEALSLFQPPHDVGRVPDGSRLGQAPGELAERFRPARRGEAGEHVPRQDRRRRLALGRTQSGRAAPVPRINIPAR